MGTSTRQYLAAIVAAAFLVFGLGVLSGCNEPEEGGSPAPTEKVDAGSASGNADASVEDEGSVPSSDVESNLDNDGDGLTDDELPLCEGQKMDGTCTPPPNCPEGQYWSEDDGECRPCADWQDEPCDTEGCKLTPSSITDKCRWDCRTNSGGLVFSGKPEEQVPARCGWTAS